MFNKVIYLNSSKIHKIKQGGENYKAKILMKKH